MTPSNRVTRRANYTALCVVITMALAPDQDATVALSPLPTQFVKSLGCSFAPCSSSNRRVHEAPSVALRATECGAEMRVQVPSCAFAVAVAAVCAAGSSESSSCRETLSCTGLQECFDDSGYYHEDFLIRAPDWTAIVCLICAGILPWVVGCIVVACLPIFFPKTQFSLSSLLLCGNTAKCQSCCRANHYTVHNRQEFEAALEQHAEQVQRLELAVQQETPRIVIQVTDGEKQVSISVHPESTGADVASQLNVKEGIAIIFADNVINPTASLSSCGIVEGGLLQIESRMNVRQDQNDVVSTPVCCKCPKWWSLSLGIIDPNSVGE